LLNSDQTIDLGTEGSVELTLNESSTASLNIGTADISTQAGAEQAIQAADNALIDIGRNRASLGAQQNRFESAITQREIQVENSAASESYIRDADFARLSTDQTRNQILLQSGLSAMTQSNILPQSALSLLG
jgi:flagellin